MKNLFDIHCHILPQVDDGARNMDMALKMLKMEYDDGVRSIILTPHFRREMFETPQEKIEDQFARLKEKAEQRFQGLQLYLGCEFHANMTMSETLLCRERPSMAGSDYVLTEFSSGADLAFVKERIYDLVSHGFLPIIAHVERYSQLRKDLDVIAYGSFLPLAEKHPSVLAYKRAYQNQELLVVNNFYVKECIWKSGLNLEGYRCILSNYPKENPAKDGVWTLRPYESMVWYKENK